MQNKNNNFVFFSFWADDFATNKNKWWKWFETFAKKYYLKFLENEEKLWQIITDLNQRSNQISDIEFQKARRIYNYLILFQSININDKKDVEINDIIMNTFEKIKNKKETETINFVVREIEEELAMENEKKLSLDELYKIVISFYKEKEYRKLFFTNLLINEKQNWDFNNIPLKNNFNFIKNMP